jgi:hypothetical protein
VIDKRQEGLTSLKTANRVALAVFLIAITAFLITIFSGRPVSSESTVVTYTKQIGHASAHASQTTTGTQRVVSNAAVPPWQIILGSRQEDLLGIAVSILAAYFLAAIIQRVLLGHYAISVGPFSIPDLTDDLIATLNSSADNLAPAFGSPGSQEPEQEKPGTETPGVAEPGVNEPGAGEAPPAEPETQGVPAWVQVNDANLAVVGLRIDLETELRRLATVHGLPQGSRPMRRLASDLADRQVISHQAANSLQDLLTIGNQAAHGKANIDDSALAFVRTEGMIILGELQAID